MLSSEMTFILLIYIRFIIMFLINTKQRLAQESAIIHRSSSQLKDEFRFETCTSFIIVVCLFCSSRKDYINKPITTS